VADSPIVVRFECGFDDVGVEALHGDTYAESQLKHYFKYIADHRTSIVDGLYTWTQSASGSTNRRRF